MNRNEYVELDEVGEYGDKYRLTHDGKCFKRTTDAFGVEHWRELVSSDADYWSAINEALSELAERQAADAVERIGKALDDAPPSVVADPEMR